MVAQYQRDMSEWKAYRVDPEVYRCLSISIHHHGAYVKLLAERLKELGVGPTFWITTQTKPFCKLHNMKQRIDIRDSHTSQEQFGGLATKEKD